MKVAAHPLIVAAALGLLGPVALESEEAEEAPDSCAEQMVERVAVSEAPSAEQIAQVEAEWHAAVLKLDAADLSVG